MGAVSCQPLANSKGVHREGNLKEAGGKVPAGVARTLLDTGRRMSLHNKTKSNKLNGCDSVNDAGIWNESDSFYRGRSHRRVETANETWIAIAVRSQPIP
jgi:hypothetical protein